MKRILPWVISVLLALICLNVSPSEAIAAETNLVVNGSFENPEVTKDWKLSQGPNIEVQYGNAGKPYDGKKLVELDGKAVSKIYQDLPTEVGKTYKLTFAFSPRAGVADNKLNVYWGDTLVAKLSKSGSGLSNTKWQVYTYDNLKATDSTTRLSFDDLNEKSDTVGSYIDAISVVAEAVSDPNAGFKGEYWNNIDLSGCPVLTRIDKTINFNWAADASPDPKVVADRFSDRWTGLITPKYSEKYTFTTTSDDGVRLWIDDLSVINNWTPHSPTNNNGSIELTAGKQYKIRLEHNELGSIGVIKLYWSSPSQAKELVTAQVIPDAPPVAPGKNLVENGSFETPVVNYVGYPKSIPGWKMSEKSSVEIQRGIPASKPYDGEQLVELDGNGVSEIYQDITTEPGKTYKLTFAFSARPKVEENKLKVRWGNELVATEQKSGKDLSKTEWEVYSYEVKATSSTTRLSFDNLDETPDGLGTFIDEVSVVRVEKQACPS